MIDDVGTFRTTIEVASLSAESERRVIPDVLVDTGSEYNWVPAEILGELGVEAVRMDRFETADGRILEREVGFAMFFAAGRSSPAIAVFARPGDMILLGAHGLEGMNLRVDLVRRELLPPVPSPRPPPRLFLPPFAEQLQRDVGGRTPFQPHLNLRALTGILDSMQR